MSASALPLAAALSDWFESEPDVSEPRDAAPRKRVRKVAPLSFEQRACPPPILLMADVAGLLGLPSEEAAGRFLRKYGIPRAFLAGRMGWEALHATLIISGAFGVFRRSIVVEAGGFATNTVGEDMELVVRLHRHCVDRGIPYRITFNPDPVAWTEAPESLRVLGRQRDRWQRGLTETLTRHRGMLFRKRYGTVGLLAFPHFFFLEMLGPLVELVGFVAFFLTLFLGLATPLYILAFLSVAVLLGVALSIFAVGLEEISFRRYPRFRDLLHLFVLAIVENLGYRQLNSYWRIRGMISFLRKQHGWGEMTRKGFASSGAK